MIDITHYPAYAIASAVNQALLNHSRLVITAPPGAGKSTVLPLTMLPHTEGRIIMLEPRRLAAQQVAMRMAAILGEEVGQTVGYRVRLTNCTGPNTRIEVVTEAILTRMLVEDPTLEGVSCLIFDEFHERSIHSEVALTLAREAQQVLRDDLRLVIMSATIDANTLTRELDAMLIESEGRLYPVTIHYATEDLDNRHLADGVARAVLRALDEHEGDILVFLPGQADILRCQTLLSASTLAQNAAITIAPLYSSLPPAAQSAALRPAAPGVRKVVLATNIAETSLTIEGVRIVIDAGLYRTEVFDSRSSLSRLETVRISQDMAGQRAGRAGRLTEGVCYRLFTNATWQRMAACRTPEIMDADLSSMLLQLALWQGQLTEEHIYQLPWLCPPPVAQVRSGLALLHLLEVLDEQHRLTSYGRRLANLPCHPRIGKMLLTAMERDLGSLACDIAALLEEKDPSMIETADFNERIEALHRQRRHTDDSHSHASALYRRVLEVAASYRRLIHATESNTLPDAYAAGALLACAYPERIARREQLTRYQLSGQAFAQLDDNDPLAAYTYLAIANLNADRGGRIYLAAPVHEEDLLAMATPYEHTEWNSREGRIVSCLEQRIGRLVLSTRALAQPDEALRLSILCNAISREGLTLLNWDEAITSLQLRLTQVHEWHPELALPDITTEALLSHVETWLAPFLTNINTAAELHKLDIAAALWASLPYETQQTVERLAPTHLTVPTGSRIRVEYRVGAQLPVLRVRLQECFGLTETPRVNDGETPVLMELLSPGFKPVQLTSDLHSFWSSTYFEVRKELKRRYPKHAWPDNPLEAPPTRGVRRG